MAELLRSRVVALGVSIGCVFVASLGALVAHSSGDAGKAAEGRAELLSAGGRPAATLPGTSAQDTKTQPRQGNAGSAGTPRPSTTADTWPPAKVSDPRFPISISVSPSCAARGESMTVRFESIPKTHIGLIGMYSDGSSGEGMRYVGPTAPDGSFTAVWVIAVTAPLGEGRAMVAAGNDGVDYGQGASAPFRVAGPGECG